MILVIIVMELNRIDHIPSCKFLAGLIPCCVKPVGSNGAHGFGVPASLGIRTGLVPLPRRVVCFKPSYTTWRWNRLECRRELRPAAAQCVTAVLRASQVPRAVQPNCTQSSLIMTYTPCYDFYNTVYFPKHPANSFVCFFKSTFEILTVHGHFRLPDLF